MPEIERPPSIDELFNALLELEPKPVANFVPANADEQRELFMSQGVRNPNNEYAKLAEIDFDARRTQIKEIQTKILEHEDLNPKYVEAYEQFVQAFLEKTDFMDLVNQFKQTGDTDEKNVLSAEIMKKNVEIYGEPDEATYRSLVAEKIAKISAKELSESGVTMRDELFELLGTHDSTETTRFRPSEETVAWMHEVSNSLYGGMLSHIPEGDTFQDEQIKSTFEAILTEEFGDSAKDWVVAIEDATAINVKPAEKRIVVPAGREVSADSLRKLIGHEIGIHLLRYAMGAQTDLPPFKRGLSDYYDTEEGLGSVMEQSLNGEYKEAGIDHYITAGLGYHDKLDFRDVFEAKWRLSVLNTTKGDPTEAAIEKAKKAAYKSTMRSFRGTDTMPWFKDLSYYNGAAEIWKHLEEIQGDDLQFMFVLLGKGNPANTSHRRIMLETATPSFDDDPTEEEAAKV